VCFNDLTKVQHLPPFAQIFLQLFLQESENIFSCIDNQHFTKKACPTIKQSRPGKQVMAADYPLFVAITAK